MKRLIIASFMAAFGIFIVAGCGGGGGGTGGGPSQPTKAVVKLVTSGSLTSGTTIGGIDITVSLAPGVSVKSTANPPETDSGVVIASGVASTNSTILATYSAPTSTIAGKVRLLIGNTSGFSTGEFATINGDIAAGNSPTASGFTLINFSVTDLNGATISGLTPGFTADIH